MKKGPFEIAKFDHNGSPFAVTVIGYTDETFGIDKRDDALKDEYRHGKWVITHLRTGCSLGYGVRTLKQARDIVSMLYQLPVDWNRGSFGMNTPRLSFVRSVREAQRSLLGRKITQMVFA
jgi:hypothetical protein